MGPPTLGISKIHGFQEIFRCGAPLERSTPCRGQIILYAPATDILMMMTHVLFRTALRDEAEDMFFHAYNAYMEVAWPADELMPLSCRGR